MEEFQKLSDEPQIAEVDFGFEGMDEGEGVEVPVLEGDHGLKKSSEGALDHPNDDSHESKRRRMMEKLPPPPQEVKADELAEPDETVVAATVLCNAVIIKAILKKLSIPDLLRARLVNRTWKGVANAVLKTRKEPPFIAINEKTDLDELISTIWNCGEENFPFSGLKVELTSFDFGKKPEKWSRRVLFQMFGHLFTQRRLHLDWSPMLSMHNTDGGHYRTIKNVLVGPMSTFNEIVIKMGKGPFDGDGHLILEATTVLKFVPSYIPHEVDDEWLAGLLQACPNLQEIRGIHFASMAGVLAAEKSELVVDMIYCEHFNVRVLNRNREGRQLKKLRSLQICPSGICDSVDFQPVCDILEASKETLNKLEIGCGLGGSRGSAWPELRSLNDLLVSSKNCFPNQVSQMFPSLTRVTLNNPCVSTYNPLRCYLWDEAVPSVTFLHIRCEVNHGNSAYLAGIFPNVSCIFVDCSYAGEDERERQPDLWNIWTVKEFQNLRKLTIVDLSVQRMIDFNISLDAFLTGYPQFIVNKLRAQPELVVKEPYTDLMREAHFNLTSLKGLQSLSIVFDDFDLTPEDLTEDKPFVSDFLFRAGLDALPGLQARFFCDFSSDRSKDVMKKLLHPVSHAIPIMPRPKWL